MIELLVALIVTGPAIAAYHVGHRIGYREGREDATWKAARSDDT